MACLVCLLQNYKIRWKLQYFMAGVAKYIIYMFLFIPRQTFKIKYFQLTYMKICLFSFRLAVTSSIFTVYEKKTT